MNIIKECCCGASIYVIRTDSYGSSLKMFLNLFAEASKDFPGLKPEDVQVVKYAGRRYARTFGIEFRAEGIKPDGYVNIAEVEDRY